MPGSTYNENMRELLTCRRRKLLGYLILATLLMKIVAPALSHTLITHPTSPGNWRVAICTATGLKYIAANTATADAPGSQGDLLLHTSSVDHCLVCSSGGHDGLAVSSSYDAIVNSCARAAGLIEDPFASRQKSRWSPVHPRAPPRV